MLCGVYALLRHEISIKVAGASECLCWEQSWLLVVCKLWRFVRLQRREWCYQRVMPSLSTRTSSRCYYSVTSTEKVMFLPVSVYLSAGLCKKDWTDLHWTRCNTMGHRPGMSPLNFWARFRFYNMIYFGSPKSCMLFVWYVVWHWPWWRSALSHLLLIPFLWRLEALESQSSLSFDIIFDCNLLEILPQPTVSGVTSQGFRQSIH